MKKYVPSSYNDPDKVGIKRDRCSLTCECGCLEAVLHVESEVDTWNIYEPSFLFNIQYRSTPSFWSRLKAALKIIFNPSAHFPITEIVLSKEDVYYLCDWSYEATKAIEDFEAGCKKQEK